MGNRIRSGAARRRRLALATERLEPRMLLAAGIAVADYRFTNHGLDGSTELFSSDTHAETTASEIASPLALESTGNGEPPRGLALTSDWNESSEPTPAGGQPDYFSFTITPDTGFEMTLSLLSFQIRRNDPESKNSFAVYFDEDPGPDGNNFATRLVTGAITSEDVFEQIDVSLEGMPEFTNLTTALTFRYYAWGTAGIGTQRLDNIRVHSVQTTASESSLAYYGNSGRLIHPLDALGNRIADFSTAGYRYGNESVPDVTQDIDPSRIVEVSPIEGDDTAVIQAAIDQVSSMTLDASGFRGVVQLGAGEFQVDDQLLLLESGVVLRGVGDGDDPADSTILRGTGSGPRALVVVGENTSIETIADTTHSIVDKYVPVGATSFEVDSTSSWSVGDEVIVERPSTAEWIAAIGMDSIPPRSDGSPIIQWAPGSKNQLYERVITRMEGNRVFLNAPLMNSLEQQYGGGIVYRYTYSRINNIGIENIRGVSDFASDTDENHARTFIELRGVEDAWVTNVTGQHLVFSTVHATSWSRRVTVDDAVSLDPKSEITDGRRYPFNIEGQFILMKNLRSEEGRHDFVNNSTAAGNRGPNVFLNGTAVNSHSSTGPHQRWASGTLYDTITTDNAIEARNRGNFGTGHGWAGANMVYWNTIATQFIVQSPPSARNWLIGSSGAIIDDMLFGPQPPAIVDAHETPIDFGDPENPLSSLYVAQRNQRDSESSLDRREYLLGDYDLGEFDGSSSVDNVPVDPIWGAQVAEIADSQPIDAFDLFTDGHVVPFSFGFEIDDADGAYAAVLTLGLRGTGGDTSDDSLWFESIDDERSFASLGIASPLAVDTTTPVTIELTRRDLGLLNDGLLNLAVGRNTAVDWAALDLLVGPAQADTVNDHAIVDEGSEVVIDVLANDVGASLLIARITQGSNGTVTSNGDETVTYKPRPDFFGDDSFTYTVLDSRGGADRAVVSVTVLPVVADSGLTWDAPSGIVFGTPLSEEHLNASASVPGTFVYTPAAGIPINAGDNQTLSVTFTPDDPANFAVQTATVTIDVAQVVPTVIWDDPDPIVFGTRLGGAQLNAQADVAGHFQFEPTFGSTLAAGRDQTLTATFTPLDAINYATLTTTVSIDVLQAVPVVQWSVPADIVFGTLLDTSQLSARANVAGTIGYDPPIGAMLSAGEDQILTATFTPDDSINYESVSASVPINVHKADPLITWVVPASIMFGTALDETQLNAMSDVDGTLAYTPDAGEVLAAGVGHAITVEFTPTDEANVNSAVASVSLDVLKADPVITWEPAARLAAGMPLGDSHLNASSDVSGQFLYSPAEGTALDAGRSQLLTLLFVPADPSNFNTRSLSQSLDVIDADVTVVQSDGTTVVSESGTADTLSIVLNDRPSANVAFRIEVGDNTEIKVRPESVVFDSTNWNVPKLITITGLADAAEDGDQETALTVTIDEERTDDDLFRQIADQTVAVTNTNRAVHQFRLSITNGKVRVRDDQSGRVVFESLLDAASPASFTTAELDDTIFVRDLAVADAVSIDSGAGDDTIQVFDLGFASIDAGLGHDRVLLNRPGETIDLGPLARRIQRAEEIEVSGDSMTLLIAFGDVGPISGGTRLVVHHVADSEVEVAGSAAVDMPSLVDGRIHHVGRRGGDVLEIVNTAAWINPFDRFDVNRSGDVTSRDALAILNDLSGRGVRDLLLPASPAEVSPLYLDANGDDRLSAADALAVINEMTRRRLESEAEHAIFVHSSPREVDEPWVDPIAAEWDAGQTLVQEPRQNVREPKSIGRLSVTDATRPRSYPEELRESREEAADAALIQLLSSL